MTKRSNNDKRHRTQRQKDPIMIKNIEHMAKRSNNDKRHRTQWPKGQIMIKDIEHNDQKIQ